MCSPATDEAGIGGAQRSAHLDAELALELRRRPGERFAVIVTASGPIAALRDALPPSAEVRHVYRLVASLALEARGDEILALAAHPAVGAIEPVRDVAAM